MLTLFFRRGSRCRKVLLLSKKKEWDFLIFQLFNDMEGKIGFSASATPEYAEVLQEFGVRDSEGVFFFIVEDCSKINCAF